MHRADRGAKPSNATTGPLAELRQSAGGAPPRCCKSNAKLRNVQLCTFFLRVACRTGRGGPLRGAGKSLGPLQRMLLRELREVPTHEGLRILSKERRHLQLLACLYLVVLQEKDLRLMGRRSNTCGT